MTLFNDSPTRRATGFVCALLLLGIGGCDTDDVQTVQRIEVSTRGRSSGDFKRAMDFLNRMNEFEPQQAEKKILFHLRKWLQSEDPNVNWVADPLATRLPQAYRPGAETRLLASGSIEPFDIQVLREASWIRDISRTVMKNASISPDLAKDLADLRAEIPESHIDDISTGVRLFDWVVRNIQTDAESTEIENASTNRYAHHLILRSWESLLMGHGTKDEKARLFILLCRQFRLDAIMLGIEQPDGNPKNWVPALLLDRSIYLFDMERGAPLAKANGKGIATLEEVLSDPTIVQGELRPALRESQLKQIVAMIDATPAAMSQRMANIESAMTGEDKMVLTVKPTQLAKILRECKGVTRVEIWTMPYEGFALRNRIANILNEMPRFMLEHHILGFSAAFDETNDAFSKRFSDQSRAVDRRVSLRQARLLHFKGQYVQEGKRGAANHYLGCLVSDSQLDQLRQQSPVAPPGEELTSEQIASFNHNLRQMEMIVLLTKENAIFWLGLMTFEQGNFAVAERDYFGRLLKDFPDSKWKASAIYNLGRSMECMAYQANDRQQLQKAIEVYLTDKDSPQAAQCRLRAKIAQARLDQFGA